MASSAVTPSRAAPYPVLVGTATTGAGVRPPTTLARAPSMPAMTTTASASGERVELGQKPVQSGNAAVGELGGLETERAQDRHAFDGDGEIGRSGGDDDDGAGPGGCGAEDHCRERPTLGNVALAEAARRCSGGDSLHLRLGGPGEQDRTIGPREQLFNDGRTVFGRLAGSVDRFGYAEAQVAVMVHPGEPQVRVGETPKLPDGIVRRAASGRDIFDEGAERGSVHELLYPAQL